MNEPEQTCELLKNAFQAYLSNQPVKVISDEDIATDRVRFAIATRWYYEGHGSGTGLKVIILLHYDIDDFPVTELDAQNVAAEHFAGLVQPSIKNFQGEFVAGSRITKEFKLSKSSLKGLRTKLDEAHIPRSYKQGAEWGQWWYRRRQLQEAIDEDIL